MKAWLWGLLWWLLVSAMIVVVVLLVMFLLAACTVSDSDKGEEDVRVWPSKLGLWMEISGDPSRSSYVLGRDVVLDAETMAQVIQEGYLRSQPSLAWPQTKPRVKRLISRDEAPSPLAGPSELPWRGLVVYDLNEPAFPAGDSARKAARTFLGCEVRAWIAVMGNMPKDAVGYAAGERGAPQIHPSWQQKMAGMGLDLEIEQDRWTFALWLAENSGWSNWAYCQHTVKGADGTSGEW